MKFYQHEADDTPEMNMTPLLDVLFVLLVLFILIAPLLQIDRIDLVSSKETKTVKTANFETRSKLIIEVDASNKIFVNKEPVELSDLSFAIDKLKVEKNVVPILMQDKKSQFGVFETIKLILESKDFKQLDVLLKP